MSLCECEVMVECDECGEGERVEASILMGGQIDTHGLTKYLESMGWSVFGSEHHCPDCTEANEQLEDELEDEDSEEEDDEEDEES